MDTSLKIVLLFHVFIKKKKESDFRFLLNFYIILSIYLYFDSSVPESLQEWTHLC